MASLPNRGRLIYYIEDKMEYVSSLVFHTAILKFFQKRRKSRNVASFLHRGRTKLENLSSIVFHTVLLKKLYNMAKIKKCDFISVFIQKLEYLLSIVFHTAIVNML